MTDFLTFLNTADQPTLRKVPGVSNKLAENIIAARPFDYVDDALLVPGVGKSLLSRMQDYVHAQGDETENRAMVPVEEEAMPAPIWESQPAQESAKEQESLSSRLGRAFVTFLRALLKLVLIIILIGSIGAALYYGLPYLNRTLIAPMERNTAQIDQLESDVSILQTQLAEMNNRMDALESSIETHTLAVQKLEEMQTTLESELDVNNNKVLLELKHEVMLTRALDMLGRARLYLAQSNFGLAKVDVQSARDLLFELQTETDDDVLGDAVERLDLALGNLPAFPIIAAGDLEIAWQILISGNVPVIPTATSTSTPSPLETFTPSPFPPPTIETTTTP